MTTILGEHSKMVLNPDEPVAEFSFAGFCQGCGDKCEMQFCDVCRPVHHRLLLHRTSMTCAVGLARHYEAMDTDTLKL